MAHPPFSLRPRHGVGASGWRRRAVAAMLMAAAVSMGLAACSNSSSKGFGQLMVNGMVRVTPAHGGTRVVHSGYTFQAGDVVEVVSGAAAIQLTPAGVIQLRSGTEISLGSTMHLMAGDILLQPLGHSLRVSAPGATLVVPAGAAQLAVGPAVGELVAKVYQSTSDLTVPGGPPVAIAAPRQVDLRTEANPPLPAVPLQYRSSDSWDRLYLAQADQISSQLAAAVTGFNAQVPASDDNDALFYEQLVPQLSARQDFVQAFETVTQASSAPPASSMAGDYLIASIIALRATRGSLEGRLTGELAFFAQGAPWGFVAYDQGVTNLTGVLNDVLSAIGRATLPFSGSSPQIAIAPPPPTTTTTMTVPPTASKAPTLPTVPPVGTPTTVAATPTRPTKPVTPTTTTVPPLIQLPVPLIGGPLGNLLNPLLDPLIQALNNILAGKG